MSTLIIEPHHDRFMAFIDQNYDKAASNLAHAMLRKIEELDPAFTPVFTTYRNDDPSFYTEVACYHAELLSKRSHLCGPIYSTIEKVAKLYATISKEAASVAEEQREIALFLEGAAALQKELTASTSSS